MSISDWMSFLLTHYYRVEPVKKWQSYVDGDRAR